MEILTDLLSNADNITFGALFVGLLVYVMKTNEQREEQYRETISELTHALSEFESIKETVQEINRKVDAYVNVHHTN